MGLRDVVKSAAKAAVIATGDIAETASYYVEGSSAYDASSGVVSVGATKQLVSMVFYNFDRRQVDNIKVLPTDMQAIIDRARFSTIPSTDDYIRRIESGVSVTYEIQGFQTDPADAHWNLHLRKA